MPGVQVEHRSGSSGVEIRAIWGGVRSFWK
jgi:hypothetical protein